MRNKKKVQANVDGVSKPPDNQSILHDGKTIRAANDNGRGRRVVVLRNFEAVPLSIDEIAVIDRLMQDSPIPANDNWSL